MDQRIKWIDSARGLGLLLVIVGHLKVPYVSAWIYTFHMPLFFFLSGLVFSCKEPLNDFFKKKFRRLIVPYFTLGGGIFTFWSLWYVMENRPVEDYFQMLVGFLTQKHYWTIWFLAALFISELMYGCINKICKDNLWKSTLVSITLCVTSFLFYRLGGTTLPWNVDTALVAQFFIHLGYVSKRVLVEPMDCALSQKKLVGISFIAISLLCNALFGFLCIRLSGQSLDMSIGMYGNEICTILSALTGIFAVVILSHYLSCKWLSWMGRNTMVLFAWHSRIVILGCQLLFSHWGFLQGDDYFSKCISAVVIFCMIIVVLVPITLGLQRTKYHCLFGV